MIEFNLNDYVKVQLTDAGRAELKRQQDEFNAANPQCRDLKLLPEEDGEGWSEWQLWMLIDDLGHMIGICKDPPFSFNILLDAKEETR